MLRSLAISSSFVCLLAFCHSASAQIEGIKSRIPTDANAVVIINASKLFGSSAAQEGRWEARRDAAFEAGLTYLSPKTTGVVIAANVDVEYGKTVWQLSQVRLGESANLASIAARFGGEMDSLAGRPATRLPNDSIVVQVTDKNYASYTPANRQDVSRWLATTDATSVSDKLSPYIDQAFAYVEKVGTPIIMAIDLQGVFSVADLKARMDNSPIAEKAGDKLPEIITLFAGIQGTTLGITTGDKPTGAIRIDFASDCSILAPFGKDMLINVLTNQAQ